MAAVSVDISGEMLIRLGGHRSPCAPFTIYASSRSAGALSRPAAFAPCQRDISPRTKLVRSRQVRCRKHHCLDRTVWLMNRSNTDERNARLHEDLFVQ